MRRIIQFGTSRFLQAHAYLFVHEARAAGQEIGPIAVVKTTQGGDRAGRIAALKSGRPYPVRIRGLESGKTIDETIEDGLVSSNARKSTKSISLPPRRWVWSWVGPWPWLCVWLARNSSYMPKIATTFSASLPLDCSAMRCVASISRAVVLARCR